MNGTSEKTLTVEVGSFGVHEQHLEEVLPPGTAEGDDSCAKSGERIDKLPLDSKDDQKGDVTQELEDPNAALADTEALGGGTKESPDTNGPKLTEEEAGAQGAKVYRESEKSIKPQVEEEQQKPEGELAEP